jgi:hypothetical protein
MIRSWKTLGWNAFLAALFVAHPALAEEKKEAPTETQRLEEFLRQLRELRTTVAEMKQALETIDAMEKDIRLGAQIVRNHKDQIEDLKRQVTQLQEELRVVRGSAAGSQRTSGFLSTDTAAPGLSMARVELANTYSTEVAVVVNGRTYHLLPGERRLTDPIPAGTFTYEVLGVTPMNTRTVAANQIYSIHVHPQ